MAIDKLLYGLLWAIVWPLSRLPMWCLYRISDGLFVLLCYVFAYRKPVIERNLKASFPGQTKADLDRMRREFYRHFCDVLVETLKSLSISDAELQRRVQLQASSVIAEVQGSGKGAILLASHYGNFEWMMARLDLHQAAQLPSYGVYTPFRNAAFDRLMRKLRERRGVQMLPMKQAMSEALRKLASPCLFGMIADQSPHAGLKLYFTSFLHQATAFHHSFAKIALRTQTPLYYVSMQKLKRGHYQLRLQKIEIAPFLPESPTQIQRLTDHYAALLEADIQAGPPYWLWSHRRWKHSPRPSDVVSQRITD